LEHTATKEVSVAWTTRLLVVANQTLDSPELLGYLQGRAQSGPLRVTFVVPARIGEEEAANARLQGVIEQLAGDGIEATGTVGDSEPCGAALDVFDARSHDEIVVSTLPNTTSQWLAIDLPHRLRKATDAQVHHVVASEPRPAAATTPVEEATKPRPPWFERLFPLRETRR
jgi:hypothetical protein